jgi:hypothetical protein
MFAVHVWRPQQGKQSGSWVEVRSGLQPLVCDGENVAEGAIRQIAARGRVATATAADESMAMKASPTGFWKWRRLSGAWHDLAERLKRMLGAQLLQTGSGRRSRHWWAAGGAAPRSCPIIDNLVSGGEPLSQAASWGL